MRGSGEPAYTFLHVKDRLSNSIIEKLRKTSLKGNIVVEFGLDANTGTGKSVAISFYNGDRVAITLYKCPPGGDLLEAVVSAVKENLIYPLTSWKAWVLSVAGAKKTVSIVAGLLQALVLVLIILRLPESLFLALALIALLMLLSLVESLIEVLRDSHLEKSSSLLDSIHRTLWLTNSLYKRHIDLLLNLIRDVSIHACTQKSAKGGNRNRGGLVYIGLSLFNFKIKNNRIIYSRIH
ncbi:MAG: hypothetical protein F7C07_01795 [Desulfurococcales archaeon]|nr:hypothetical protein [Desulfurococcales archaeon]